MNIYYFNEPQLVQSLWPEDDPENRKKISSVYAAGSQCYALEIKQESKTNQLYSWGFGASYVLGNREEENEFKPYAVHPKMFEEMPIMMLAAGT